jgi:cytoskeleton protein RodZ
MNSDNNLDQPVPGNQGSDFVSPGDWIRQEREDRGLDQKQLAKYMHLTVHYVNALENCDYNRLPALTFVKGYYRTAARLLAIDEEALVACYEAHLSSLGMTQPQTEMVTSSAINSLEENSASVVLIIVILLLILASGAMYWFGGFSALGLF